MYYSLLHQIFMISVKSTIVTEAGIYIYFVLFKLFPLISVKHELNYCRFYITGIFLVSSYFFKSLLLPLSSIRHHVIS